MLGDIIYEQKDKISGYRVLDTEGPTIETTITGTGIINGIEVTDIVTYWNNRISDDVLYGEGQGVIIAINDNDNETATFKEYGIGKIVENNKISWSGSIIFQTNSKEKLSFLNNTIGLFETEEDNTTKIVIEKV